VILSRKFKKERTWDNMSTNSPNIVAKALLPCLILPILLFKNVLTSCTVLITEIGIPTPPIAVGVGKTFKTWYTVSIVWITPSAI
jgi:hypothetical protein